MLYLLKKKKPEDLEVIIKADRHFSLEERLITFWEYKEHQDPYGLIERLKEDLEERIRYIDLRKAYSFRPSRLLKTLAFLTLILLALNLIVSPPKNLVSALSPEGNEKAYNEQKNSLLEKKAHLSDNVLEGEGVKKQQVSQEDFNKEKVESFETPKSLEEFLSQWDFDKNNAKSNESQKESQKTEEKKEESTAQKEGNEKSSIGSSNNMPSLGSVASGISPSMEEGSSSQGEKEEGQTAGTENMPAQSQQERMIQAPIPGGKVADKKDASSSLPGTEERNTKLGEKESERKVFSGENVSVPSPQEEEKGKNYLFQAPTLTGERKTVGDSVSVSPQYQEENPVASRILPQEFQDILKIYFSQ